MKGMESFNVNMIPLYQYLCKAVLSLYSIPVVFQEVCLCLHYGGCIDAGMVCG